MARDVSHQRMTGGIQRDDPWTTRQGGSSHGQFWVFEVRFGGVVLAGGGSAGRGRKGAELTEWRRTPRPERPARGRTPAQKYCRLRNARSHYVIVEELLYPRNPRYVGVRHFRMPAITDCWIGSKRMGARGKLPENTDRVKVWLSPAVLIALSEIAITEGHKTTSATVRAMVNEGIGRRGYGAQAGEPHVTAKGSR